MKKFRHKRRKIKSEQIFSALNKKNIFYRDWTDISELQHCMTQLLSGNIVPHRN